MGRLGIEFVTGLEKSEYVEQVRELPRELPRSPAIFPNLRSSDGVEQIAKHEEADEALREDEA